MKRLTSFPLEKGSQGEAQRQGQKIPGCLEATSNCQVGSGGSSQGLGGKRCSKQQTGPEDQSREKQNWVPAWTGQDKMRHSRTFYSKLCCASWMALGKERGLGVPAAGKATC